MLDEYEINEATMAVIPIDSNKSKVIEENNIFIVNRNSMKIIDDSCKFFGSSYNGRFEGSKRLLGNKIYKAPIIIEESREIIYFPTGSSRNENCAWISLKKIKDYSKNNEKVSIKFKNDIVIDFEITYEALGNQVLRASRLETILRQHKNA